MFYQGPVIDKIPNLPGLDVTGSSMAKHSVVLGQFPQGRISNLISICLYRQALNMVDLDTDLLMQLNCYLNSLEKSEISGSQSRPGKLLDMYFQIGRVRDRLYISSWQSRFITGIQKIIDTPEIFKSLYILVETSPPTWEYISKILTLFKSDAVGSMYSQTKAVKKAISVWLMRRSEDSLRLIADAYCSVGFPEDHYAIQLLRSDEAQGLVTPGMWFVGGEGALPSPPTNHGGRSQRAIRSFDGGICRT